MAEYPDIAWAAGLFEGEGTIYLQRGNPTMQLRMIDPEPVERFQRVVGGGMSGPHGPYAANRRAYYSWACHGWQEAERVLELIGGFLSSRRLRQVAEVFEAKPARPIKHGGANLRKTHCPQGHPYNEENTYVAPSSGHRQCRTCRARRKAHA